MATTTPIGDWEELGDGFFVRPVRRGFSTDSGSVPRTDYEAARLDEDGEYIGNNSYHQSIENAQAWADEQRRASKT